MPMFCCVHTDQWSADTGFIGDDDQEQEVEALKAELKTLVAPEIQAIIDKLSVNTNLLAAIKKSVLQQLTISIEAEKLGKIS